MANINNQGRWVSGQKSSKKRGRATASAAPVKRERPARAARSQADENGLKVGDEVVQPGNAGPGIIIDIRKIDESASTYGVRSPGGETHYFSIADLGI